MHPYSTTYERYHQFQYSPTYSDTTVQNHMADQPSGATHNNVATSINPKDGDTPYAKTKRQPLPNGDMPMDGTIAGVPEDYEPPPFVSDYKATFVSPHKRQLVEGEEPSLKYTRDFKIATHAIPPPICSDSASQEEHQPFSGSGYTTNNAFAFDTLRNSREMAVSHYKQTFLGPKSARVPILHDGTVDPAPWRRSNAYTKAGDTMPSVHAANEGAQPWLPSDFESHSRRVAREAAEAPRGESTPTRTIQRPSTVATNQTRRPRIEHSAFSRSERGPPTNGLGTEHMKLRLGSGSTGSHHLSTRPHTAGHEAAPFRYHSAHTNGVAPIAVRVGTGIEDVQQIANLKKLRTKAPADYHYELANAPRYTSTYSLLHDDKWKAEEEKNANMGASDSLFTRHGLKSGQLAPYSEDPSTANGGVRNPFETSYMRAARDAANESAFVRAQGKQVARPQETGYTQNDKPRELLQHRSHTARGPQARFALTSHLAFQHPDNHSAQLPPATGHQINTAAPLQSSYSREHTSGSIFPAPVYNTIVTLNGRTIVAKAEDSDQHPTVQRAMKVLECGY